MDKTPEQINEIVTEFADSILRSLGFEHELSTEKCDAEEISLMIALAFVWIAITTVSNWSIA